MDSLIPFGIDKLLDNTSFFDPISDDDTSIGTESTSDRRVGSETGCFDDWKRDGA